MGAFTRRLCACSALNPPPSPHFRLGASLSSLFFPLRYPRNAALTASMQIQQIAHHKSLFRFNAGGNGKFVRTLFQSFKQLLVFSRVSDRCLTICNVAQRVAVHGPELLRLTSGGGSRVETTIFSIFFFQLLFHRSFL